MLVQLLVLVFCQSILAGRLGKPYYDTNDYEAIGRHFEEFLQKYDKQYDEAEKTQRFGYFIANVVEINKLNEVHKNVFDITHLSDWSDEELSTLFGIDTSNIGDGADGNCQVQGDPTTQEAPEAFDWREHGAVSPVKAQGSCGSCWAFGTAGLVESRMLQQNKQVILSEQQLVDCDTVSNGCHGGLPSHALTYLMQAGGQVTEESYPYKDAPGTCQFNPSNIAARVQSCTDYSLSSEVALKELLYKEGPLAIMVAADPTWFKYPGGIFEQCNNQHLNHEVLLVGYGSENGEDFWIIKNSWGATWGEQGFIRLKRGVNCCAIAGIGTGLSYAITSATVA